jgi:catechol 2,3-dioxygenase-like lactoylglutathione lyase family enzyme
MPSQAVGGTFLEEVSFETSNVEQLRGYLLAIGTKAGEIQEVKKANRRFSLTDPDGHHIGFIQYLAADNYSHPENQVSGHLIHAGFVVRDRAAEEHFYKDLLGFRPYWHGGMKDDQTDWVSLQVPDGGDWVEFMVNVSPNADHHTLGVMNHIALGVPDIHAAQQQLIKNGWKSTEEPKIGRDGKWQLNLYDPDDTRVEFMEFKPVEKPCCSEFTAPHPGPQSPSKKPAQP